MCVSKERGTVYEQGKAKSLYRERYGKSFIFMERATSCEAYLETVMENWKTVMIPILLKTNRSSFQKDFLSVAEPSSLRTTF